MKYKSLGLKGEDGVKYNIKVLDIFKFKDICYMIGIDSNNVTILLEIEKFYKDINYNIIFDRESEDIKEILNLFNNRAKEGLSNLDIVNFKTFSNVPEYNFKNYIIDNKNSNNKKYAIFGIFISIIIFGSIATYIIYDYNKQLLIQKSKEEQLKIEQKTKIAEETLKKNLEETKQQQLDEAIAQAKKNRESLWDANADEDGRVNSNTLKWIEDRYNEEVQTAIERYK